MAALFGGLVAAGGIRHAGTHQRSAGATLFAGLLAGTALFFPRLLAFADALLAPLLRSRRRVRLCRLGRPILLAGAALGFARLLALENALLAALLRRGGAIRLGGRFGGAVLLAGTLLGFARLLALQNALFAALLRRGRAIRLRGRFVCLFALARLGSGFRLLGLFALALAFGGAFFRLLLAAQLPLFLARLLGLLGIALAFGGLGLAGAVLHLGLGGALLAALRRRLRLGGALGLRGAFLTFLLALLDALLLALLGTFLLALLLEDEQFLVALREDDLGRGCEPRNESLRGSDDR
ncbi:hypothetical protein [Methylobrevis albus]|uniref:Uncharacterized protein n=1 Tax=Methylobrevis albus TaxID=2793297 RepID=A0A931I6X3_9HYPH|nr:hypothetical protein [Methylobrevis albus]MBH0239916.1 hypothetical protein [Methylobrevis albus]